MGIEGTSAKKELFGSSPSKNMRVFGLRNQLRELILMKIRRNGSEKVGVPTGVPSYYFKQPGNTDKSM